MYKRKHQQATLGGEAVRLTTSKIITLIITMLTTMFLARFRSFEEYGTYSQLLLIINLVTALLMLGLPNSINFFLARAENQEERKNFLSVYYTLSTLLSIVIGLVLMFATPLIEEYFHNPLIRRFYYFLALFPWTSIILSSIENVLVVYKKTSFLMMYRIVVSTVSLGMVLLIQWAGLGFSEYMIAFVVSQCFFAISVYIIVWRIDGGIVFSLDKKLIKSVLIFSIPIGLSSVVGTFNTEIDKLLIGYLMDTSQMAIYSNAAKELPLTIVASSITAVLLPQLTRMIKKEKILDALNLWGYATELSLIIICLIVAGLFTYADAVITILYSAKYIPGVSVFRVYTLNLLLRITYFGIILNAFGETKRIFYCSIISLILNVVLNPLLFYLMGMIGPAVATFLAILMVQLLQLKMTSKVTHVSFSMVFPWKQVGYIIGINTIFAVIFWFMRKVLSLEFLVGDVVESVMLGAIWTFAYVVVMRKRIISRWDRINSNEID